MWKFWQDELMTIEDKWHFFQFSFSSDNLSQPCDDFCDEWWIPLDDPVNPWWKSVEDPDDNIEDLLTTLTTTGDYLVMTHNDDTDNPFDDSDRWWHLSCNCRHRVVLARPTIWHVSCRHANMSVMHHKTCRQHDQCRDLPKTTLEDICPDVLALH